MFTLIKKFKSARLGTLQLKHGKVETPVFMPVGTVASVKTMLPEDLHKMEAQIILGNTYHLFLRPGLEIIREFDGLHNFMSWDKPILTDSGGYQIFSLGKNRKITEEGAFFASHLDGQKFMLTPELAVKIQETLGSDIHMVLDECPAYPITKTEAEKSLDMTLRWAERSRKAKTKADLCQFGIVQGGMFEDLRLKSIEHLSNMNFEGYSIGGLSVGEPKDKMIAMVTVCGEILPSNKPRYLMGVGTPLDLIESVNLGVDMFDCVMPTRNARNGCLFTSMGKVTIKHSKYKMDKSPLDPNCSCYTCENFSKSYLRHLYQAKELSALRLFTLHNLTYYQNFMQAIRESIKNDTFTSLLNEQRAIWS